MKLIVNGQEKEFNKDITLFQVLEKLELVGKVMAAAVNMNIIKQGSWENYILKDADRLELLDFVGGG